LWCNEACKALEIGTLIEVKVQAREEEENAGSAYLSIGPDPGVG